MFTVTSLPLSPQLNVVVVVEEGSEDEVDLEEEEGLVAVVGLVGGEDSDVEDDTNTHENAHTHTSPLLRHLRCWFIAHLYLQYIVYRNQSENRCTSSCGAWSPLNQALSGARH